MSNKRIDIQSKHGFSLPVKLLAVVFIIVSFIIIPDYPAIAAILSFLCLLILTAKSGIEIDMAKKTYQQYMSYFWIIKMGKPKSYDEVDHMYITSGESITKAVFSSGKIVHQAILKFMNGDKIPLIEESDKQVVRRKAEVVAKKLGVEVMA
ncbi:MAG: hypothetical protein ACNS60_10855 [Candidatus Cyclobacteriaceae bacterium M2_1C_046]